MKALISLLLIVSFENARAAEETTLQSVLEELENLKKIISQQQTKIGSLEENLKSVTEQNRKLQEEVVHLKSDQEVIREKLNLKQTKVPNIPKNFGEEPRKKSRGSDDIVLSRHKRLLPISQSPLEVGFTALRHQDPVVVHTNAVIIFETAITNTGSAYNPSSGIFRAPTSGLYVFFYDIECMRNNGDTYVELVRNGTQTGIQAYCHGSGDVDNSSTLGVLQLSTGDTVWVRLYSSDNITFGGKTLFSGFLL
uniref:Multimerin-2-like n=1 Tax=Crassostrea virginica TaxID=6565 RepID=A0A8B8BYY3_CRAVI|nr:multimerin-2-like [Crassostrea virginica]